MAATWKDDPKTVEFEAKAKSLLKSEIKRRGFTYAALADRLTGMGVSETERNLNNKISRGGFSAAFFLQCLEALGSKQLILD